MGQLINVELLELEREDECCGFGGTFAIKEQHIFAAMVKDKLDDISKTAINRHLGGECGCLLKISGVMKHFGNTLVQKHSAEFIWERSTNKKNKIKE